MAELIIRIGNYRIDFTIKLLKQLLCRYKNKIGPNSVPYANINSSWIKIHNVKTKLKF